MIFFIDGLEASIDVERGAVLFRLDAGEDGGEDALIIIFFERGWRRGDRRGDLLWRVTGEESTTFILRALDTPGPLTLGLPRQLIKALLEEHGGVYFFPALREAIDVISTRAHGRGR